LAGASDLPGVTFDPERLVNMGIVRAFKRLLGLLCVAVAALLGLFALFGYFADDTGEGRTVAAVIGGLAVLLLVIGWRWLRRGDATGRRTRRTASASADSPVLVVVNHPHEIGKKNGLRFHLYECAGVKSGKRSGCKVETISQRQAQAQGRTICAFCAEGRTDDPFYEPSESECAAVLAKWPTFAHLRFGDNPPTARQFAYAVALGVNLKDGVTFDSISKLIGKAKASAHRPKKADRPSDEEVEIIYHAISDKGPTLASMLKTIEDYHGVLPRKVSAEEAQRIIEFLEDRCLPCPFCGIEIFATDDECCACGKSLRKMRIPIKL
jgi:hypothetical protein